MNPLSWISSIFGGISTISHTIDGITAAISNERIALIGAQTDRERIEIQGRIDALCLQRDVLAADAQRSKADIYVRTLYGLCALAPVAKILVWDKTIGAFMGCTGEAGKAASCLIYNTDKLSDNDWKLIATVVGFYFVSTMFRK